MSVFRFAPSPNGYLHLGHALSALLNADRARATKGKALLRIEDIDETRCRPEYETAIYEDLAWLGLAFAPPVRKQSQHYDDYRTALIRLDAMGLIYPSFESRAEIAALAVGQDPDGAPLYTGAAKSLSAGERARRIEAGEPYALRLDMAAALSFLTSPLEGEVARRRVSGGEREGGRQQIQTKTSDTPLPNPPPQGGREKEVAAPPLNLTWSESGAGPNGETGIVKADPAAWGDVILARKETPTSYHLAVVVDDAAQGVTDVVRGRDLFHATSVHRLLQALLELPQPRYHHHRLILDAQDRKLSKSTQATGLRELRAAGASPADIRKRIGLD
ncbi:MAG TPA: glutamate--tRNA ligase family protein [Pseudolabrys sp.]